MARKTHDICVSVGEYEQNGQTKKRWAQLGIAITDDRGGISLKFDTLPGPNWSGWMRLFPSTPKNTPPTGYPSNETEARAMQSSSGDDFEDDIPF